MFSGTPLPGLTYVARRSLSSWSRASPKFTGSNGPEEAVGLHFSKRMAAGQGRIDIRIINQAMQFTRKWKPAYGPELNEVSEESLTP